MGASNSSSAAADGPTVVIVGAGYAGRKVATLLDKHARVVLIEKKNYSQHAIGLLRAVTKEHWAAKCAVPLDKLLMRGGVYQADVATITPSEVVGADGRSVTFDYLVIATGAQVRYPGKADISDAAKLVDTLEATRAKLAGAKSCLIIGGGPVGCELAGEVAHSFPDCATTLVHSRDTLCTAGLLPKFGQRTLKKLEKKGVTVMLGERTIIPEAAKSDLTFVGDSSLELKTESGKVLPTADVVFFAIGNRTNSAAYEAAFAGALEPGSKRLRVGASMQVEGHTNVFSLGDCALTPKGDWQMAFHAGEQAQLVFKNILLQHKGRALKDGYGMSGKKAMFVPIGPTDGVCQLPFGMAPSLLCVKMKSKDLFTSEQWKESSQPVPKSGEDAPSSRKKRQQSASAFALDDLAAIGGIGAAADITKK